ncbi:SDR family NAD(P)-dependent oxidoreductase [Collimonas fungivorans]|uniref:SDR family NAD(P)-dependent oxidoreductase n=1 Tax=Collimonas fungivorans TaxID=158899 RepID=UPI003FA37E43
MNDSPFGLQNKIILVTGASSGIGRAAALLCSELGATVVLCGRDMDRLNATLTSLSGTGHTIIPGDLINAEARHALVDAVPPLDGCVFSAGVAALVPMRMVSEQHLHAMFSVNYEAPVMLTQRLLSKKKINNDASLVFVTARAEHFSPIATGIYSGVKAALTATVRTIALEHAKQGIRANCISPGYVDTPMLEKLQGVSSIESKVDLVPLGAIEATDIANGIAYLLAPASRWVTRSSLVIDGGLSLRARG